MWISVLWCVSLRALCLMCFCGCWVEGDVWPTPGSLHPPSSSLWWRRRKEKTAEKSLLCTWRWITTSYRASSFVLSYFLLFPKIKLTGESDHVWTWCIFVDLIINRHAKYRYKQALKVLSFSTFDKNACDVNTSQKLIRSDCHFSVDTHIPKHCWTRYWSTLIIRD